MYTWSFRATSPWIYQYFDIFEVQCQQIRHLARVSLSRLMALSSPIPSGGGRRVSNVANNRNKTDSVASILQMKQQLQQNDPQMNVNSNAAAALSMLDKQRMIYGANAPLGKQPPPPTMKSGGDSTRNLYPDSSSSSTARTSSAAASGRKSTSRITPVGGPQLHDLNNGYNPAAVKQSQPPAQQQSQAAPSGYAPIRAQQQYQQQYQQQQQQQQQSQYQPQQQTTHALQPQPSSSSSVISNTGYNIVTSTANLIRRNSFGLLTSNKQSDRNTTNPTTSQADQDTSKQQPSAAPAATTIVRQNSARQMLSSVAAMLTGQQSSQSSQQPSQQPSQGRRGSNRQVVPVNDPTPSSSGATSLNTSLNTTSNNNITNNRHHSTGSPTRYDTAADVGPESKSRTISPNEEVPQSYNNGRAGVGTQQQLPANQYRSNSNAGNNSDIYITAPASGKQQPQTQPPASMMMGRVNPSQVYPQQQQQTQTQPQQQSITHSISNRSMNIDQSQASQGPNNNSNNTNGPPGAVAPASKAGLPVKLCCDKCDGKHMTEDCPHYNKNREAHPDAQKNFYKKIGGSSTLPGAILPSATIVRQPGDGSCLFHSLCYGLRDGSTAASLRQEICSFINKHPNFKIAESPLSDWVKWDSNSSCAEYARRMSLGAWGGGIEMACLSQLKNVNVHVYEVNRGSISGRSDRGGPGMSGRGFSGGGGGFKRISAFDVPVNPENQRIIRVLYCGGVHYEALVVN